MQQILSAAQSTVLHASSNLGPPIGRLQDADRERHMHTNFDLNNAYNDEQDCVGHQEKGHSSVPIPFWAEQSVHKSSAPQTSGNSESTSGQSGSSGSDSQVPSFVSVKFLSCIFIIYHCLFFLTN